MGSQCGVEVAERHYLWLLLSMRGLLTREWVQLEELWSRSGKVNMEKLSILDFRCIAVQRKKTGVHSDTEICGRRVRFVHLNNSGVWKMAQLTSDADANRAQHKWNRDRHRHGNERDSQNYVQIFLSMMSSSFLNHIVLLSLNC